MPSARTLAAAAAVALALSGCAHSSQPGEAVAPGGSGESAPTAAVPADPAAELADLEFSGVTLDGAAFSGQELAGRPAVLWFWAPWCPTCRAQAPAVSTLAEQYEGEVAVIGVGGLADPGDIKDVALGVAGPTHLVDEEGDVWRHFGITAQSVYVVLDADGAIVSEGYLDDEALADLVADLTS